MAGIVQTEIPKEIFNLEMKDRVYAGYSNFTPNFFQIVAITDSGKRVKARLVKSRTVKSNYYVNWKWIEKNPARASELVQFTPYYDGTKWSFRNESKGLSFSDPVPENSELSYLQILNRE